MKRKLTILWFRRDLRFEDNPLLKDLAGQFVLPLFVFDPFFFQWEETSHGRIQFLYQCLESLAGEFASRNSSMKFLYGNTAQVFDQLLASLSKDYTITIRYNYDVQIDYGLKRDKAIDAVADTYGISVQKTRQNFWVAKGVEAKVWRDSYHDYMSKRLHKDDWSEVSRSTLPKLPNEIELVDIQAIHPSFFNLRPKMFAGGRQVGIARLNNFLEQDSKGYHWKMSRPYLASLGATSHLSPHLTFGVFSTREIYQKTLERIEYIAQNGSDYHKHVFSLRSFLERLRWRNNFTIKLEHTPHLADTNRFSEFDEVYNMNPLDDQKQELYERWKTGTTGFALIDASMRQLKKNGWMNFRMRAMNASFLTIICGISWQYGAVHFMNFLIDGDIAIDSWQWQMQAGITNPFSKTFRIYNPSRNIIERDPDLAYIKLFVPELSSVSLEDILEHEKAEEGLFGNRIGDYPSPMLNWNQSKNLNGSKVAKVRERVRKRLQGLNVNQ